MGTPSMSKRISELERQVGLRLFERTSRDVRLTPEGEVLLGQVRRVLAEINTLRVMAADAAAGAIGTIRVAYAPGTGELMTVLAREVRRRLSGVVVRPVQMISLQVASAVRSRSVEVGIARVPPGPDLATLVLTENPLTTICVPVSHPLAERDEVLPEDLTGETLIVPSPSVGGTSPHVPGARFHHAEVTTEGELFDLVSSGFGLYISTAGVVQRNRRHDIMAKPYAGPTVSARVLLLWRPDNDSRVVTAIRKIAEEIRAGGDPLILG